MCIWWRQTTWVVLVPITTHIPCLIDVAHTEPWIFDFFVISQSEQICKWGIKYAHLVTTDQTCAHHYDINVAHTEIWIFDFCAISQSEQICKWGIKYAHSVTTDHMGSICAHHYPHTKFHQCSPYRTLDIWLFVLANQNRYANEVLNMRIRWLQTTWVVLVRPTTHIQSLTKISHCVLFRERRFTFWCWRETYISTYIQTAWQMKTKWSFQHSWRPTMNWCTYIQAGVI